MHLGRLSGWPFAFLGERYTESPRVGIGAVGRFRPIPMLQLWFTDGATKCVTPAIPRIVALEGSGRLSQWAFVLRWHGGIFAINSPRNQSSHIWGSVGLQNETVQWKDHKRLRISHLRFGGASTHICRKLEFEALPDSDRQAVADQYVFSPIDIGY